MVTFPSDMEGESFVWQRWSLPEQGCRDAGLRCHPGPLSQRGSSLPVCNQQQQVPMETNQSPSLVPLPSSSFQPSLSPSPRPICQSVRLLCLWWGLNPEPLACKVYALPLNGSLHPQSSSKLLTLNSLPPCGVPLQSAGCSLGYARHFSFMRSYLSIVGSKIFTLPPSKDLK